MTINLKNITAHGSNIRGGNWSSFNCNPIQTGILCPSWILSPAVQEDFELRHEFQTTPLSYPLSLTFYFPKTRVKLPQERERFLKL